MTVGLIDRRLGDTRGDEQQGRRRRRYRADLIADHHHKTDLEGVEGVSLCDADGYGSEDEQNDQQIDEGAESKIITPARMSRIIVGLADSVETCSRTIPSNCR